MPIDPLLYLMERVREDNPDATAEELSVLQAEALRASPLTREA